MAPLILASSSPRRRQLLQEAGLSFEVVPAECEETHQEGEPPETMVTRLAEMKACWVAERHPGRVVLGADTAVALDRRILGKPANDEEARNTLAFLSGKEHQVLTGVCLVFSDGSFRTWYSTTRVVFKSFGPDTIERYMGLVKTSDKAGSYAIQEHGDMLVQSIEGLQSNVIGLPVEEVLEALQRRCKE